MLLHRRSCHQLKRTPPIRACRARRSRRERRSSPRVDPDPERSRRGRGNPGNAPPKEMPSPAGATETSTCPLVQPRLSTRRSLARRVPPRLVPNAVEEPAFRESDLCSELLGHHSRNRADQRGSRPAAGHRQDATTPLQHRRHKCREANPCVFEQYPHPTLNTAVPDSAG